MTRAEIENTAKEMYPMINPTKYVQLFIGLERLAFIAGANFVFRTQLENKRDAYINRIGYEPEHKDLENWNLQIELLNKKIEEL